jgi:hypothetical protein
MTPREHATLLAFVRRSLGAEPWEPLNAVVHRVLRTPGHLKGVRMAAHVLWPGAWLHPSTLARAAWWLRAGAAVAVLLMATGCGSPIMPCSDAGASPSLDASGEAGADASPPFDAGAGDAGDAAELVDVAQVDVGVEADAPPGVCCNAGGAFEACSAGAWRCLASDGGTGLPCDLVGTHPPCGIGDGCEADAGAGVVVVCP